MRYGIEGALLVTGREVGQCSANEKAELDFIVHVYALWPEDRSCVGCEEGGRGLEEEEGGTGAGVVEFFDVVAVEDVSITVSTAHLMKLLCLLVWLVS